MYLDECPCCGNKATANFRDEERFPGRFLCKNCCKPNKTTLKEDMDKMGIREENLKKFQPVMSYGLGDCEKCC